VICNYVDNPWLEIPWWVYGTSEDGSSGSGLFNTGNRQIGTLGGGLSGCVFSALDHYGKLHANYPKASVKNTLNPSHSLGVDLAGMDARKISCYEHLILPGEPGVSGQYFPANHYRAQNKIVLQANDRIETTQYIYVHPDADYEFRAGNSITLNPPFVAAAGSNFLATISPCPSNKTDDAVIDLELIARLNEIELPNSKNSIGANMLCRAQQRGTEALRSPFSPIPAKAGSMFPF